MKLSDFDYHLPDDRIAQAPATPRDASRLLVVRPEGPLEHRVFRELDALLSPGDLLVLNDTKVIPARLVGRKPTGGKAEILLCEPLAGGLGRAWRAMGQASKGLRAGTVIELDGLSVRVVRAEGEGFYEVELDREGEALAAALARAGALPLPPYIRRAPGAEDADRYQTVVARAPGSAAAPTAGLHFTPELLARLDARGVARAAVTLHVGPGTFLPVRGEDLGAHRMHGERYEVPPAAAAAFEACRARGGRVIAVGTTTVRTLESAHDGAGLRVGPGRTELFIRPGHPFRATDSLVTNFHLPRSTLLVLVCAFAGRDRVLRAYREAIDHGYRFFSYGDAMWLPGPAASGRVV
jgi:S-adenosylmethionine:tRNA ribosyltransferase-isomerase